MNVQIRTTSQFWQAIQRSLFVCAALLLGFYGFVQFDIWLFQHRERQNLERLLQEERLPRDRSGETESAASSDSSSMIGPDGVIGRIDIARLGVSVVVVEGTAARTLTRATGHIAGTALPGQPGNVAIAGHRDTFFRPLQGIQRNDVITLTTVRGEYRYRVLSTKVVNPLDVSVLIPDGGEILTLITCYPFYFVGPAPDRFIVRAERVT